MNRLRKLPVIAAVLLTAVSCSVNRRQAEKARELFSHGMEMVELGGGEMAMSDFKKAEPILAEIGDTAHRQRPVSATPASYLRRD